MNIKVLPLLHKNYMMGKFLSPIIFGYFKFNSSVVCDSSLRERHVCDWLVCIKLTQIESFTKRKPLLNDCLHQMGLWTCLWRHFIDYLLMFRWFWAVQEKRAKKPCIARK